MKRLLVIMFSILLWSFSSAFSGHAFAYDISGTVSYPGGIGKRVYVSTSDYGGYGTSIASVGASGSAAFTIRGVPAGTYTLTAFADTTDTGSRLAFDPYGSSSSITVTSTNITGASIALTDPAAVTPQAPGAPTVYPGDCAALVKAPWSYGADSYTIYWSSDSSVSPAHTTGGGHKTIPSTNGSPLVLVSGLQNGQNLYFVVTARRGLLESTPSAVVGPITIGVPSGGGNVSGTISYGGGTAGPLVMIVSYMKKMYFSIYANPSFPLNYTVSGIPDGNYRVQAGLDVNGDGIIGNIGDVTTRHQTASRIAINGSPVSGLNVALPSQNAEAVIGTSHYYSSSGDSYYTYLRVYQYTKRVTNVTITAGPGISGPVDIKYENSEYQLYLGATRPTEGSTWNLTVGFADGSTENLSASITGIVDGTATPISPTGFISTGTPAFTWSAPIPPPSGYFEYSLRVSGNNRWSPDIIPSSKLSVPFNYDGSAYSYSNGSSVLISAFNAGDYSWDVMTSDKYGNNSFGATASFSIPPPSVNEFTIATSSSTFFVPIMSFSGSSPLGAVASYCLSETNSSTGCVWSATPPIGYIFSTAGMKTLYAWVKDNNGSISASSSASVAIAYPLSSLIPSSGQTTCYGSTGPSTCSNTGQDGELQTGIAWPSPRFTSNIDNTVTDNLTGLIWDKNANSAGSKTWQQALDYIKSLNSSNYLGHNDWRLPNIKELASLVSAGQSNPATWLNSQGFSNVQANGYWSSSSYSNGTSGAWIVGMGYGGVSSYDKAGYYYVWPVRAGQIGSLGTLTISRTGQTSCYNDYGRSISCEGTGQDGELQTGIAWSNPRFTSNIDNTVTDNLTGLIWDKNANTSGSKTWQQALDYIKSLNSSNYLGHNDWRLPNIKELATLVNAGQSNLAVWLNSQGFSNVQTSYYWSSSSYSIGTSNAWVVYMNYGYVDDVNKANGYYVWPVRAGQSGSLDSLIISGNTTSFGSHALGGPPTTREVILGNNGSVPITISSLSITDPASAAFSVTPGGSHACDSLNPSIAAGAYCTVSISFSPTLMGANNANLVVSANSKSISIPMSGTGVAPSGFLNLPYIQLAPASTGVAYSQYVTATGGSFPYTFSKSYGTLPSGLSLNSSNGLISGIPTISGTFTFAIAVTDNAAGYAEIELSISVTTPLTINTPASLPRGTIGSTWTVNLTTSGGAPPYTYSSMTGTLANNLTMTRSGVISGTPSISGSNSFTVYVTDSTGRSASKMFSFDADAPFAITTTRLNDAITGIPSSQTLAASGGYAPYIWSIFSGQLPAGLSLNSSTGVISGTATNETSKQIVVSLNDNAGRVLYKQFTMNALNPLQITTTAMPNARVGNAYSELIRTSGGIAPFTYSYTGLLPAGLSLHPTTGIVYGTPSSAGYVNLGLTVTDSSYPIPQSVTQVLGVRTTSQMTITSNSVLPTARVNTLINPVTLTVAGGISPFNWSIISGTLPPGINFNTSTGTISGTPTTAGDYIVTLRLGDSAGNTTGTASNPDKQFFMHVSAPLVITTTTVPVGGVGIPYATNLAASGGQLNYSWSVAPGTLPAGLSLNSNGTISGIPTAKISGSVTFTVTDSDISPQTAQKAITFAVKDTLSIIESSLPNARSGQAYTSAVHAMLGTPPYTWRVSAGVKPDGLDLVQNAGIATLQGTPSTSGTYSYTIELTDSSNPQQVVTQQYTTITYEPFSITKTTLNNAERTVNYYDVITVNGGVSPYTYTLATGTLPQGLSLNPATGVVSGAPVAVTSQSSTFTVRVTDSGNPAYFVDKEFSIFVTDPVPVVGACGGNNGKVLAAAPTTGLCTSGAPSAVGVWNWSCVGQYGGAPASCSAIFGYPVSVTVTGSGYGTVTSDAIAVGVPSDISCSKGTCSAGYPNASVVTLTAIPGSTSTFTSWSGACTTTPCMVTTNAPKAVTATFTAADRARVVGGAGFSTLVGAYLEAAKSASATIKTLDTTLNESLTMDKPVAITLTGGWNATFGSKTGMPTVLNGVLTIGSGSLTVDELTIGSPGTVCGNCGGVVAN